MKVIIKLKFGFICCILPKEFSSISEENLGESFALNKLRLGLSEQRGVIILNKSGVENCISSYKNQEPLINPWEVWDSISLNLPWGLIILFIFAFVSINKFFFSLFSFSTSLSKIWKNLLNIEGCQIVGSFGIRSIILLLVSKLSKSERQDLIILISSSLKSSSKILCPVNILGVTSWFIW